MLRISIAKKAAVRSMLPLLAAVMAAGPARVVSAGFPDSTGTEMCTYSKELQRSTNERQRYIARLGRAQGVEVVQNSAVEDMYGEMKDAGYSDAEEGDFLTRLLGAERKQQKEGALDGFSVDCLGCHDGVHASSVAVNWRNDPYRDYRHRRLTSEHPVGMDYQMYASTRPADYKPIFGNTRMLLVNGKVGCLTCHDPLNPERRHLVMSDYRSALCFTCHVK